MSVWLRRSAEREPSPGRAVETVPRRKPWLDWQRGLAVLFMIEVHVLDAWLAPGAAHGSAHAALRFVGGLAAPGFLFMAGLSQSLADAAWAARGVPAIERRRRALWRAVTLLGVAWGVRLLEVLASTMGRGAIPWEELFRVDVLHVIAISLACSALLVSGRPRVAGALAAGAAAILVIAASPAVAHALGGGDVVGAGSDPAARLPERIRDALLATAYGRPPRATFSLFNWSAFLLAGAALGPLATGRARPGTWLALGAGLAGLGWLALHGPAFVPPRDFWRASPAWFLLRLGICCGLAGLLQLLALLTERGLGWLAMLGRRSLLGYVFSVEITYGEFAAPLKHRLTLPGMLAASAGVAALTWAICEGWDRWSAARSAKARRPAVPCP